MSSVVIVVCVSLSHIASYHVYKAPEYVLQFKAILVVPEDVQFGIGHHFSIVFISACVVDPLAKSVQCFILHIVQHFQAKKTVPYVYHPAEIVSVQHINLFALQLILVHFGIPVHIQVQAHGQVHDTVGIVQSQHKLEVGAVATDEPFDVQHVAFTVVIGAVAQSFQVYQFIQV